MISQIPPIVLAFGGLFALVAGIINVVGYLSFEHQAVTHLTGTTTLLGAAVAASDTSQVAHLLFVIGSFLLGAVLSGFIVQDSTLKLGRRYGVVLVLESIALFGSVPLLEQHSHFGMYLAGLACGLQNAMATTYSGTVIRTSHVTGMFTDLGIFLGQFLRGLPVNRRRLLVSLTIILCFFFGGVVGGLLFPLFSFSTLYFPAVLIGVAGVGYIFLKKKLQPWFPVNGSR